MQQLTFLKPGSLEWHEVQAPRIETDVQMLVRPLAVTTCDLDCLTLTGRSPLAGMGPYAFGHEFVAEVTECGESVKAFSPGDRVSVPFQISCGACDRCRAGLTGSCREVPPTSMYGFGALGGEWGGAFSDTVRVPFADAMAVHVPTEIAIEKIASLSDNLPDAWRTVAPQLAEYPGAEVLIVGGGANSIPLYAVAIALALGAKAVDYYDADPQRLEVAARLGAAVHGGPPPRRAGSYAISIDASANEKGLGCALRSLQPGGICTSIGIYYEEVRLPLLDMYTRGVRFHTGRVNARAEMPSVLELITSGKLQPELVNSEVLAWDDAARALVDPSLKPVFIRDAA